MPKTVVAGDFSKLRQLVSDEWINEVMEIGDSYNKSKWEIGDRTAFLRNLVTSNMLDCSIASVYSFMAGLTRNGASARTVEYYALVASSFGEKAREEYPLLTFSHFDAARSFDDPFEFLDRAMELFEQNGSKVPSVEAVRFTFSQELKETALMPDGPATLDDVENSVDNGALQIQDAGEGARLNGIIQGLQTIASVCDKFGYGEVAKRLREIIEELTGG